MKNILIGSSHALLIEGICHLLTEPGVPRSLYGARSMPGLLKSIREKAHDVIILAEPIFDLPLEFVARRINEISPAARIVALHHRLAFFSPSLLLKCGVYALLRRNCTVTDLQLAVHYAGSGKFYLSDYLSECLALELGGRGAPHLLLSQQEIEVFIMLLKGYRTADIAVRLSTTPRAVSWHKSAIKRRINAKSFSEMVQYALSQSLV
jgi:DNA-binding NarL/FixJ family response regulator